MSAIEHDPAGHRFTAELQGERAVLDYRLAEGVMTITHTGVPAALRGRGVAAELTREALRIARERGWRVFPACSYAAAYLEKHPDEAGAASPGQADDERRHQSDLLDEALEESFPASDPPSVGRSS